MIYISYRSPHWRPMVDPWPWYTEDQYSWSPVNWWSCNS